LVPFVPLVPAGPVAPSLPFVPLVPAGPVGPVVFHESFVSSFLHFVLSVTRRIVPFFFTQTLMVAASA
jgi:hypothetical protein